MRLQTAVSLPNMGVFASAQVLADLARDAEQAGWDGVFVWDSLYIKQKDPRNNDTGDPWIALAAIALQTQRVRIETLITPIARRRPWKLARETVTLDHLSNSRMVLPVGLGAVDDGGFSKVGEPLERKSRAQRLDEGLAILDGLWSGEPFSFAGDHFQLKERAFLPRPLQFPRVPVWVVAAWPWPKSMQRGVHWDGVLPFKLSLEGENLAAGGYAIAGGLSPEDVREIAAYGKEHRNTRGKFDIVLEGITPGDDPSAGGEIVQPYAEAGATWWIEAVWDYFYKYPGEVEPLRERILRGPPELD